MDVVDAIKKRRSVRHYKPDEIPEDVLNRLLNAMRLAPSACNNQPWKFIVVRDGATKAKLAAACHYATRKGGAPAQTWIAEAPVVIVACGSDGEAAVTCFKGHQPVIAQGGTSRRRRRAGRCGLRAGCRMTWLLHWITSCWPPSRRGWAPVGSAA